MVCTKCSLGLLRIRTLVEAEGKKLRFCPVCGAPISEPKLPTREDLLKQLLLELEDRRRDLNRLEEKRAKYGMDAPISLLNEIDEVKADIARLLAEIDALQS